MGTVGLRWLGLVAALAGALFVPTTAGAATVTYQPPYTLASQGGDEFNYIEANTETGEMTVLRVNPFGINGGLGCGGAGGYANFQVVHPEATPVKTVTVSYDPALVDPYSWINVGVRKGGGFITSTVVRGLIAGSGAVTVVLPAGTMGPVTVWFGIQVSSACPNVDGGHATFTSVAVSDT